MAEAALGACSGGARSCSTTTAAPLIGSPLATAGTVGGDDLAGVGGSAGACASPALLGEPSEGATGAVCVARCTMRGAVWPTAN